MKFDDLREDLLRGEEQYTPEEEDEILMDACKLILLNRNTENDQYTNHMKICMNLNDTYIQKNKAYGNSFSDTFEKLGIISAITRITDKYNRLVNLATYSNINIGDESIKDTLLDMANYCIMTYMELDKRENK
jgi:hypothetical protein